MGEEYQRPAPHKPEPTPRSDIPRQYPNALEVFGEIVSIARRHRLKQLEKTIETERQVIATHRALLQAQEEWRIARVRLEPDNLEAIKESERLRIRAERAEVEFAEAKAQRKLATFEKKAELEDTNLEAEKLEAQLRVKRGQQALSEADAPALEPEPEPERDPEVELREIVEALSEREQEKNELLQTEPQPEAQIRAVDEKISALLRRKASIDEKLAAQG